MNQCPICRSENLESTEQGAWCPNCEKVTEHSEDCEYFLWDNIGQGVFFCDHDHVLIGEKHYVPKEEYDELTRELEQARKSGIDYANQYADAVSYITQLKQEYATYREQAEKIAESWSEVSKENEEFKYILRRVNGIKDWYSNDTYDLLKQIEALANKP